MSEMSRMIGMLFAGFLAGGAVLIGVFWFWQKRYAARIRALTDYLEKANTGECCDLFQVGEDELSRLQDEIYKTVTELYQTREAALAAKNNFAENLYNIAHQIKTPVTSICLSLQMMQENPSPQYRKQIQSQVDHLMNLEESLLLLARIDTGTLSMEKEEVDVFTLLTLAADNLQELFLKAKVSAEIPEAGGMMICADMDWTMEAVMNLMKNCIEHTPPGGRVFCSYEQNPIYTQIRIWDTGEGFAREDMPHLFERFYKGKNSGSTGTGIGLALSKAIIESQNGVITACNLPESGACFEIRIYI